MKTVASSDASPLLQIQPASGYAGDVPVQLAFQWVQSGEAVLVDVRCDAEREWVGYVPGAVALAWKQWPGICLLYTSPSPRDGLLSRMPSSA